MHRRTTLKERERNLFKNDDRNRLFSVSKNSASKVKYDETNELVEKLSKIFHFLVTKVFIPGDIRHIYPPPLVHLATLWFVFVHRFCVTESYFLPFHIHFDWFGRRCFWAEYSTMVSFRLTFDHRLFKILINFLSIWRLPFNWRHPLGFLVAVFLQIIAVIFPFRYLSCFITFALGSYLFVSTLTNDVVNYVKSINDDAKKSKSKIDIYKKLSELVHLHSDGKQLSETAINESLKIEQLPFHAIIVF